MLACRRTVPAAATAALAAMILASPASAVGVPGGTGAFGISPAPSGGRPGPAYFTMTMAAGGSTKASVVAANGSGTAETLRLSASAAATAGNGGSAFSRAFQPCSGAGCWVTGLPAVVTLPPRSSETLPFTVHVPAGTPPRQYLAGISAELDGRPTAVPAGPGGRAGTQAIVVRQVTVDVAVTVGQPSQLVTRLRITRVSGSAIEQLSRLNVVLANTGQTFTRAAGRAMCTAGGRQLTYQVTADTVLPGDQATIPANAIGLPQGAAVSCAVRLSYGRGQVTAWAGQVVVPAPPHVRLFHTGPGAYAALPAGGIPPWAVALLVIGGLLLAGVAALLVIWLRAARRSV